MVFGLGMAFDEMGRYVAMHLSAIVDQERGSSATLSICQKAPHLLKPRHELSTLVILP